MPRWWRARETLDRWAATGSSDVQPAFQEWRTVLDDPVEGVIAVLTGVDERAARLRQSNPFAGVLSSQERNTILHRFDSNDNISA